MFSGITQYRGARLFFDSLSLFFSNFVHTTINYSTYDRQYNTTTNSSFYPCTASNPYQVRTSKVTRITDKATTPLAPFKAQYVILSVRFAKRENTCSLPNTNDALGWFWLVKWLFQARLDFMSKQHVVVAHQMLWSDSNRLSSLGGVFVSKLDLWVETFQLIVRILFPCEEMATGVVHGQNGTLEIFLCVDGFGIGHVVI